MNKKGIVLTGYIVALLIFSLVITSFVFLLDDEEQGFFNKYNYTIPTNNLSNLDQNDATASSIQDVICDINPEAENCGAIDKKALADTGSTTIQGILAGGYGTMITIGKSLGTGKVIIENVGQIIGIPPIVTDILVSIIFITIFISITLIIFNRGGA